MMISRVFGRFDAVAGLRSATDHDRAVLRERFDILRRHLPWLHAIMSVNVIGLQLVAGTHAGLSLLPAALMLGVIGIRAITMRGFGAVCLADDAVRDELRKTIVVAGLFFIGNALWTADLYLRVAPANRIDIAMFAGLAAIGASCGLSSFPAAARIPLVLLALPVGLALSLGPSAAHAGIGVSLIILTLINHRLLMVRDATFTWLVSSRFALESEKHRALEAESIAISEKRRVSTLANTDPLTGVANRRGFLAALDGLDMEEKRRLALVVLDLDGFKPINDTFGHSCGDAILVEVSRRLQSLPALRGRVARLGGDEFAFVCDCDGPAEAIVLAEEAIALLGAPIRLDGRDLRISACAGVSCQGGDDVSEAIRRADIALFGAKRRGRGNGALFSREMEQEVQRRTSIEQALRDPRLVTEIELRFQPIFELRTMELRAFEALARWRHPALGWIGPSEFIPISEQISILEVMTDELLKRAAAAARDWPDVVRLSFNLSPVQLCSAGTAEKILAIIAAERFDPNRLQIEVTETALLADFELARRNLSKLRREGVRIVLDDFGAGYSSIKYLREINFDAVKLDGSLISAIGRPGSGVPLLRGVLALCSEMGQQCVAEHIENRGQLELLRELGCRFGQGFGLCPPVSAAEAGRLALSKVLELPAQDQRGRPGSRSRIATA